MQYGNIEALSYGLDGIHIFRSCEMYVDGRIQHWAIIFTMKIFAYLLGGHGGTMMCAPSPIE